MTGWEFGDIRQILDDARNGNNTLLSIWTGSTPFVKVNEDLTKLIVLRKFQVKTMRGLPNPLVFIAPPSDELFQWGLTIITTPDDGETDYSVYVPNKYNYTGIEFKNDEITFLAEGMTKTTNIRELQKDLRKFHPDFAQADLETAFDALANVKLKPAEPKKSKPGKDPKEPGQAQPVIKSKVLGTLSYNQTIDMYESTVLPGLDFEVGIDYEDADEFEDILKYAEKSIKAKFYEKHLLSMEVEMIELKNDSWLDDDEAPITPEVFRQRISIDSIVFHSDQSCTIYCNDGDLFGEHTIDISIDEDGNYDGATLAG